MSFWQEHKIESKVMLILQDVPDGDDEHHIGRPYLTAYQIAIEFARRHPVTVANLGWPIGGAGAGERNTLAQYLARWLSQYAKDHPNGPIEGGFLSNQHLHDISFGLGEDVIHSSLTGTPFTLSMFRLRGGTEAVAKPSIRTEEVRPGGPLLNLSVDEWKETIAASNARAMQKRHQYPPHEGAFLLHCCTFQAPTCPADCFCHTVGNDGVWTLRPDLGFDAFLDAFANLWVTGRSSFKDAVHDPTFETRTRWRYGARLLCEVKTRWSDWDGRGHSLPQLASHVRRCYFCNDAFDLIAPFVDTIRELPGDNSGIYTSKLVSQLFYDIAVPFDSLSRGVQKRHGYDPADHGAGGSMREDVRAWLVQHNLSVLAFRRLDDAPARYWQPGEQPEVHAGTACSRVLDKLFYG